jgi:hypothetical protein
MKAQEPAEGIMKTNDFGNSKFYKIVCGCGQSDHDIDFEVEANDGGVNINTYIIAKSDCWNETVKKRYNIDNPWLQEWDWFWKDLVNGVARRIRLTWSVWTRGYVQTETTVAMSEQQALNYIETLKKAMQDVKDFKKS